MKTYKTPTGSLISEHDYKFLPDSLQVQCTELPPQQETKGVEIINALVHEERVYKILNPKQETRAVEEKAESEIEDLISQFKAGDLKFQNKKQFSVSQIVGAIQLAYYRGKASTHAGKESEPKEGKSAEEIYKVIEFLKSKFQFNSTGEAKAIYELIDYATQQHKSDAVEIPIDDIWNEYLKAPLGKSFTEYLKENGYCLFLTTKQK